LLAAAQPAALSGTTDPHPLIDEARQIGRELRDGRLLARCALVRFGSGISTDQAAALSELTAARRHDDRRRLGHRRDGLRPALRRARPRGDR